MEPEWQARLSPNPTTFSTRDSITGLGEVNVMLQGNLLILRGQFYGLQGKATSAHLHQGAKAIPGPAIHEVDLQISGDGKQGAVQANLQLSDEQVQALKSESLYIQLSSEVAKDGNLRGWLLEVE
jgi:hypothetical protein